MSRDIAKLEAAVKALKHLIAEQKDFEKKRDRARSAALGKPANRASEDMHAAALSAHQAQRVAWAAVLNADLQIDLGGQIVSPNSWHEMQIEPLSHS
jgi:hypothetical protein